MLEAPQDFDGYSARFSVPDDGDAFYNLYARSTQEQRKGGVCIRGEGIVRKNTHEELFFGIFKPSRGNALGNLVAASTCYPLSGEGGRAIPYNQEYPHTRGTVIELASMFVLPGEANENGCVPRRFFHRILAVAPILNFLHRAYVASAQECTGRVARAGGGEGLLNPYSFDAVVANVLLNHGAQNPGTVYILNSFYGNTWSYGTPRYPLVPEEQGRQSDAEFAFSCQRPLRGFQITPTDELLTAFGETTADKVANKPKVFMAFPASSIPLMAGYILGIEERGFLDNPRGDRLFIQIDFPPGFASFLRGLVAHRRLFMGGTYGAGAIHPSTSWVNAMSRFAAQEARRPSPGSRDNMLGLRDTAGWSPFPVAAAG